VNHASVFLRKVESISAIPIGYSLRKTWDKKRLSGDAFARLADIALFRKNSKLPSLSRIREAKVVFVVGHRFEEFVSEYSSICKPTVLIVGDSDRDWREFDFPCLSQVKRIFLQNSLIPNDKKFMCLPIGIENRMYGRNGMPYLYHSFFTHRNKKKGIFLGPLGSTHPVRQELANLDLRAIENIEIKRERMSAIEFAFRSSAWSHVLAPRGNGQDTHRFWEALYRGSVPVVVQDLWSENISQYGIRMEVVKDWSISEISRVASLDVSRLEPEKIPALWQPFWRRLIREAT
jgi:hypothetical protein